LGNSDWERFNRKRDRLAKLRNYLDNTRFKRSSTEYAGISQILGYDLGDSITLSQLSMRQGVNAEFIYRLLPDDLISQIKIAELETALADSLYRGYIASSQAAAERVNHHDNLRVPEDFQFDLISGLSNEMVERLKRAKPRTFSQIRKINGLTPTAISTVLIHLTSKRIQQTT